MAFKMATSLAFKDGLAKAKPTILEPIAHMEVIIPEKYMGDIMGDINKRRGRILSMDPTDDGKKCIVAEVPRRDFKIQHRSQIYDPGQRKLHILLRAL